MKIFIFAFWKYWISADCIGWLKHVLICFKQLNNDKMIKWTCFISQINIWSTFVDFFRDTKISKSRFFRISLGINFDTLVNNNCWLKCHKTYFIELCFSFCVFYVYIKHVYILFPVNPSTTPLIPSNPLKNPRYI